LQLFISHSIITGSGTLDPPEHPTLIKEALFRGKISILGHYLT